ncbi:MAG: hypothetical protein L0Z55_09940 [Planctomycetes bacterium]|nr:hypothetical protein [Planctomycetota bacterium]
MIATLLLSALLTASPEGYTVSLANGREYHVDEATKVGAAWEFKVLGGLMKVPAREVAAVREGRTLLQTAIPVQRDAVAVPRPAAAKEQDLARVEFDLESVPTDLSVRGVPLRAGIPQDVHRAAAEEDGIVAFLSQDSRRSLRFAWSEPEDSLWEMNVGIMRHHEETYFGYRTLGQRFTAFAGRPAWLLTFSHRKGEQVWIECQAFVVFPRGVLVVSAVAKEQDPEYGGAGPENLVRGVCVTIEEPGRDRAGARP